MENQTSVESAEKDNENDQLTAVNLRRARANLSPISKPIPPNECPESLDKPQPSTRHSLSNKIQSNRSSSETINKTETDATCAANKGPPPLPPKPKVLPIKPSNWGFNISDQTTIQ